MAYLSFINLWARQSVSDNNTNRLTLSSMIQSKVMNKRSKVTKRQKVLLTSEMHFFSPASYDSTLAQMGVVLIDPTPLPPVSRESALLLHRLSIPGHAPLSRASPAHWSTEGGLRWSQWRQVIGAGSQARLLDVDSLCGGQFHHCICREEKDKKYDTYKYNL